MRKRRSQSDGHRGSLTRWFAVKPPEIVHLPREPLGRDPQPLSDKRVVVVGSVVVSELPGVGMFGCAGALVLDRPWSK